MRRCSHLQCGAIVVGGLLVLAGFILGHAGSPREAYAQTTTSFGQYDMVPVDQGGFVVLRQGVNFFIIDHEGNRRAIK